MQIYHQHSVFKVIKPKFFKEAHKLEEWLRQLAEDVLDMKICIPPTVTLVEDEGNAGFTGIVGLTTSHCSAHFFDELDYATLDIYSCKHYNIKDVVNFFKKSLNPSEIWYSCFDRDNKSDYTHSVEL